MKKRIYVPFVKKKKKVHKYRGQKVKFSGTLLMSVAVSFSVVFVFRVCIV